MNNRAPLRLVLSLGNSSPGDGGLFEFSQQLAMRVARAAPNWQASDNVRFTFHLREALFGRFGSAVDYLPVHRVQRYRPLAAGRVDLWHSLNQLNRTLPPADCGPRVTTVHDLNHLYGRNAFSRWRHQFRLQAVVRRTDHIVAISRHTAADVQRHLGWCGPLDVIHNGARNLSGDTKEPLHGRAPGRPFLFHLSRMSPSKNPKAIVSLAAVWPEIDFVLCGPPSDAAKRLAATVKLPNVFFHLGISEAQKAWAFAHCTGFLFPSLTEGFGLPPIEAMHFGKPVFLSNRSCLPEIGGDAAFYFDDFDAISMRQVVEAGLRAAAAPGRADAVRAHAAQFDWDHCAAQYLALYRQALRLQPR